MPFLQPEQATQYLDLVPGMRVADFGCGSGHWALALAHKVGGSGKVFAIDVLPTALEATRSRAKLENLHNVETVWGDLETPRASKLKEGLLHLVVLSNILVQAEDKLAVISEAYRILMPEGRAVVVEWDPSSGNAAGGPSAQKIPRQDAESLMQRAGFAFEKEFSAGSYHYGLVFRKP